MDENRIIGKVVSRYWKSPSPNPVDVYFPDGTIIVELQ